MVLPNNKKLIYQAVMIIVSVFLFTNRGLKHIEQMLTLLTGDRNLNHRDINFPLEVINIALYQKIQYGYRKPE